MKFTTTRIGPDKAMLLPQSTTTGPTPLMPIPDADWPRFRTLPDAETILGLMNTALTTFFADPTQVRPGTGGIHASLTLNNAVLNGDGSIYSSFLGMYGSSAPYCIYMDPSLAYTIFSVIGQVEFAPAVASNQYGGSGQVTVSVNLYVGDVCAACPADGSATKLVASVSGGNLEFTWA